MNLIFHNLLGMILEVYIDDLVVKSAEFEGHLVHLTLVFEKMRKYELKDEFTKVCLRGVG
jgi:hypothetical protein